MKNITLINPPSLFLDNTKAQPPLGILYIMAVLRNKGYDIQFLDWSGEENWDINKIENDIIGITCCYPHFPFVVEMRQQLSGKKIIVGGPDPSAQPEIYREMGINSIIVGEGEKAIFSAIENDGIISRDLIKDLDSIPFPAREYLDNEKYGNFGNSHHTTIMESRGCPWKCGFCSKGSMGNKIRRRSVKNVMKEINQCIIHYDYNDFCFEGDTFTMDKKWVVDLCKKLKRLDITWRCLTRIDRVDEELLKTMKDAGCWEIAVGAESFSNKILNNISKGTSAERNIEGIKLIEKIGIKVKCFVMIGLPGETKETLQETIDGFMRANPSNFDLTIFHPMPGCDIWNNINNYDIMIWPHSPKNAYFKGNIESYVSTSKLTRSDIKEWYKKICEEFSLVSSKSVDPFKEVKK